jgi:serine/threonine protein kinase
MLEKNDRLGDRYRIVYQIHQGSMGAVYKAQDDLRGCDVAVKHFLCFDKELKREQFIRQAKLLTRLRHPALPEVHDYFTEEIGQFLVMEYIDGGHLAQVLQESNNPFPLNQVLGWANQLLETLEYIHDHRPPVIHNNIKPYNLKVKPNGTVMLLDFGLPKNSTTLILPGRSQYGHIPPYAAPESLKSEEADQRSDLYSLGATLYHLMTNRLPHDALTRESVIKMGHPDPLWKESNLDLHIPSWVIRIVRRAVELRPQDRWQSALEMRSALISMDDIPRMPPLDLVSLNNSGSTPSQPQVLGRHPTRKQRRQKTSRKDSGKITKPQSMAYHQQDTTNSLLEPLIMLFSRIIYRLIDLTSLLIDEIKKALIALVDHFIRQPAAFKRVLKVIFFVIIPFIVVVIYFAIKIFLM